MSLTTTAPTTSPPAILPSTPVTLPPLQQRRQQQPSILSLRSQGCPVIADVQGNLAKPSVLTSSINKDWLKDRWQAAKDMSGRPIKGSHWVSINLKQVVNVAKIVIDYEQAYCSDYTLECRVEEFDPWKSIDQNKVLKELRSGEGTNTHVIHEVVLKSGESNNKIQCKYVRLFMNKPATKWGVSVWEVQVWGFGGTDMMC